MISLPRDPFERAIVTNWPPGRHPPLPVLLDAAYFFSAVVGFFPDDSEEQATIHFLARILTIRCNEDYKPGASS